MSLTVCSTWLRKAFEASLNNRCASSKKKTNLGLSTSPTSGRKLNRSASTHIRKVENITGRAARSPSSNRLMMPRPLRIDTNKIGRLEFRLTEECVATVGLEIDQRTQDHPAVWLDTAPRVFSSVYLRSVGQEGDELPQILQIEQR